MPASSSRSKAGKSSTVNLLVVVLVVAAAAGFLSYQAVTKATSMPPNFLMSMGKSFDRDQDEAVSASELAAAFSAADHNKDGNLSPREAARSNLILDEAVTASDVQSAFDEADTNGDGKITGSEANKDLIKAEQHRSAFFANSDGDGKLSFWELRAMDRKNVDYAVPLLTLAPTWAISTFDEFPEDCRPAAAEKDKTGTGHGSVDWYFGLDGQDGPLWRLCPEWYIYTNSDVIMCGLPSHIKWISLAISIALAVIGVALSVWAFGNRTGIRLGPQSNKQMWSAVGGLIVKIGVLDHVVGICAWLYSSIVWPIMPWFICDALFHMGVYIVPVFSLLAWGWLCYATCVPGGPLA